ncbi:hypothetical protein [Zavarzinia compransoris]|nr:hypothetical protein [Zavarzinia compransoris]
MPDWIAALAAACDKRPQKEVAAAINYSNAVVHAVLRRNYPGAMAKVEARVRLLLITTSVTCPLYGMEIPARRCLETQDAPPSTASLMAANRARICGACPSAKPKKEDAHGL